MTESEHRGPRIMGLSALERRVLQEKAKGLSDLEVALRLCINEREVRTIAQRLKRRALNGKIAPTLAV
jgi:DNA-binding CsgD family transcriptional regulator